MRKSMFALLVLMTSCSVNNPTINLVYTYPKLSGIRGEPFTDLRNTYIDNMDEAYMSERQLAYYNMLSEKDWAIADIVNYKADDGYYSDIYKVSEKARDGYLKVNRYAMQYITDNNIDIRQVSYVYKGVLIKTSDQYRKLVRLTANDIHNISFETHDNFLVIRIDS